MTNTKYIRGGIGDLLIRVGNIKPDEHYVIISHYDQAADLIKPYTSNFEYVPMRGSVASIQGEIDTVAYPELKIPPQFIEEAKSTLPSNKTIIGIHPIGSKMSLVVDAQFGRPNKFMPPNFIKGIVSELGNDSVEFLLFCSPEEVHLFKNLGLRIISEPDIWKTFAYVACCDLMLSVESALKTVSAMLHIPTVVAVGQYHDPWRVKFLDPYKEITPIWFLRIDMIFNQFISIAREHISKIQNGQ